MARKRGSGLLIPSCSRKRYHSRQCVEEPDARDHKKCAASPSGATLAARPMPHVARSVRILCVLCVLSGTAHADEGASIGVTRSAGAEHCPDGSGAFRTCPSRARPGGNEPRGALRGHLRARRFGSFGVDSFEPGRELARPARRGPELFGARTGYGRHARTALRLEHRRNTRTHSPTRASTRGRRKHGGCSTFAESVEHQRDAFARWRRAGRRARPGRPRVHRRRRYRARTFSNERRCAHRFPPFDRARSGSRPSNRS